VWRKFYRPKSISLEIEPFSVTIKHQNGGQLGMPVNISPTFDPKLPGAFKNFADRIEILFQDGRYHHARSLANGAINSCQSDNPWFRNYLALALVTETVERMSKLGVAPQWTVASAESKEATKFFLDPPILKAALQRTLDFVNDAIAKVGTMIRPCPNCGNSGVTPTERTAPILDDGFLYFKPDALRQALEPLDPLFAQYELRQWIIGKVITEANVRVPVGRCHDCRINVALWSFDSMTTNQFYSRDMPGEIAKGISGRSNQLPWVISKTYFPIFVARWLRGVTGKSILDYGSAEGIMMWFLKTFGAKVTGVEVNPSRKAYSDRILDLPDVSCDPGFLDLDSNQNRFDSVISFHTLEHVFDLDRTLQGMAQVLKPGGLMIIAVPNNDVGGTHTIGLEPDYFRRALPRHGMEIEKVSWNNDDLEAEFRLNGKGLPVWSNMDDLLVIARRL
jgi:2-polyprenyl-3-methyl-5-hydroxy-6-metoxy-1,4-benzoquinol methylase